jgi:outer membrane murein-binding lipoprotein Lpp
MCLSVILRWRDAFRAPGPLQMDLATTTLHTAEVEQTPSDEDQTASDSDQLSTRTDQLASDRDQPALDRQHAARVDLTSAGERATTRRATFAPKPVTSAQLLVAVHQAQALRQANPDRGVQLPITPRSQ